MLRGIFNVPSRTQGEIEAAICNGISRFQQDYMGRRPRTDSRPLDRRTHCDPLPGRSDRAERDMVKSLSADKGWDLLKQVRTHLNETARPIMELMIQKVTGVKVVSLHHDISTMAGEEALLFTLVETPHCRGPKKR